MPTQPGHISFACGEDAQEILTVYAADGVTTVSVSGWAMEFVASLPGGKNVIQLSTSNGTIVAGNPAACNATLTFASAVTLALPPIYYDFQIRRTNTGQITETTEGTLILTKRQSSTGGIVLTPVADFIAAFLSTGGQLPMSPPPPPIGGVSPVVVQFTDTSQNIPTAWLWDFGGLGSDTVQNPTFTFSIPGTYSVALTAANTAGFDTLLRNGLIVVGLPAPTNLVAAGNGNFNEVLLTWNSVTGATSYNVYEGASGAETLLHSGVLGTSYTDTGISAAGTRYYTVTAVSGSLESGFSNEVKAIMVLPSIVQVATQTANSFGTATITTWNKNVTPGNIIVVSGTALGGATRQIVSVSDGQSTYALGYYAWGHDTVTDNTYVNAAYYLLNAVGGNKPTINVASDFGFGTSFVANAFEVSGLLASNPLEGNDTTAGSSTAPLAPLTITNAFDLLVTGYQTDGSSGSPVAPTGFTDFLTVNNNGAAAYAVTSSAGTYSPAFGTGISKPWNAGIVAFKGGLSVSQGVTYYLSPAGNDSNNGTNPSTPWLTLSHASAFTGYKSGDTLALLTGSTFSGSLTLTAANFVTLPSTSLPFFIEPYGSGANPIINAGTGYGILCTDVPNIQATNIKVVGAGVVVVLGSPNTSTTTSNGSGFRFLNNTSANLNGPTITNCEASGFLAGFELIAGTLVKGFSNWSFTNCSGHDNLLWGFSVTPSDIAGYAFPFWYVTQDVHLNGTITNCQAYNNVGDYFRTFTNQTALSSGYGMHLFAITNLTVSGCVNHDNGFCTSLIDGTVAFMVICCKNVTVQDSESYNQFDQSTQDGEGFDVDCGCENVILQSCWSHHNAGFGFMAFSFAARPSTGNVSFRNCISQNDSLNNPSPGSAFRIGNANWDGPVNIINCVAYNDMVNQPLVSSSQASGVTVNVTNTIIMSPNATAALATMNSGDNLIGNIYYSGGTFKVTYNSVDYASLAAMHTAAIQGLEHLGSTNYGQQGTPTLVDPGNGTSQLPTHPTTNLTAYDPLPGSISINSGVDANALLGVPVSTIDFHDNPNEISGQFDVGAVKMQ